MECFWDAKKDRSDGTWTRNLLLRRQAPYPLGHGPCVLTYPLHALITTVANHWTQIDLSSTWVQNDKMTNCKCKIKTNMQRLKLWLDFIKLQIQIQTNILMIRWRTRCICRAAFSLGEDIQGTGCELFGRSSCPCFYSKEFSVSIETRFDLLILDMEVDIKSEE